MRVAHQLCLQWLRRCGLPVHLHMHEVWFQHGDWWSWPANCSYTCMYGMGAGDMCGIVRQTTPESDIRMISAVGYVGRKINMPTSDGATYLVHEPSPHRACSTHLVCENATAAVKWAFATWLRDGTSCVLSRNGETLFCTGGRSITANKREMVQFVTATSIRPFPCPSSRWSSAVCGRAPN